MEDYEYDYDDEPEFEVEYYALDDGRMGRVWYDADAGEYVDGEVLDEQGRWQEYPAQEIVTSGEQVPFAEASDRVRTLGGAV